MGRAHVSRHEEEDRRPLALRGGEGASPTDGHEAHPRAIRDILCEGVLHRYSQYMNNQIEQDHRGIKGRYQPLRGFGSFISAVRFCTSHDAARDYVRRRAGMHQVASLGG